MQCRHHSRTSASSVLNRYTASALASSVLPTPVGPRNMKDAMGRCGSPSPARDLHRSQHVSSTKSTLRFRINFV